MFYLLFWASKKILFFANIIHWGDLKNLKPSNLFKRLEKKLPKTTTVVMSLQGKHTF